MFIGHYAPAFLAATTRKAPPLAVLVVAVQVLDFAFFSFALLGIEHYRLTPNFTASNWLDLYDMPYSHSLLGAAVLGGLFSGLVLAPPGHLPYRQQAAAPPPESRLPASSRTGWQTTSSTRPISRSPARRPGSASACGIIRSPNTRSKSSSPSERWRPTLAAPVPQARAQACFSASSPPSLRCFR